MPERKIRKDSKTKRAASEAETAHAANETEDLDAEAVQAESAEPQAESAEPQADLADLADLADRFEAEAALLKDQLLRALAETENLRRRSQRERDDAVKFAAAGLIKDLIGVADNLRRAQESVPPEAAAGNEPFETLLAGLEMTEKELNTVFEKHHIVKVEPLGELLDPHYHEAMFEVPDPDVPRGTVLQVIQAGYRLHGRLLRPAQVGVAAGGPAPVRDAVPGATAESEDDSESASAPNGGPGPAGSDDDTPPGSTIDTTA